MKKLGFFLSCLFLMLCMTEEAIVKADGWILIGDQDGAELPIGSGKNKCTDFPDGVCLFDLTTHNTYGLRFTLVYCDTNGNCKKVTKIGKVNNIQSVDIWNHLYKAPFNYYGESKGDHNTNSESKSKSNSYFYTTPEMIKEKLQKEFQVYSFGSNPLYKVNNNNEILLNDIDLILKMMSADSDITLTRNYFATQLNSNMHKAQEGTCADCYGYRIFVEPLFTWVYNRPIEGKSGTTTEYWILTPSEAIAHFGEKRVVVKNTGNNHASYTGGTKLENFQTIAKSLTMPIQDGKIMPVKTILQFEHIDTIFQGKEGYALNIINPLVGVELGYNCETIKKLNPKINFLDLTLSYDKLSSLTLNYPGNKTASGKWYAENCTCEPIYNYYWNKTGNKTGKNLYDLSAISIRGLFNRGYFKDFNESIKDSQASSIEWTADYYLKLCGKSVPGPSNDCDEVINFYNDVYQRDLTSFTKEEFNKLGEDFWNFYNSENAGSNWNSEKYLAQCPYQKLVCTPTYNTFDKGNLGTCYQGQIGYADSDNWGECIFNANGENTLLSNYNNTTYKDTQLSNDYCEIYCTETLATNFDQNTIVVEAGRNFTWNNHTISGSRTCKSKPINWDTFTTKLNAANDDIINKFTEWQLERKKQESILHPKQESVTEKYGTITITSHIDANGNCTASEDGRECNDDPAGYVCSKNANCGKDDDGQTKCTRSCWKERTYTKYTAASVSFTVNDVTKTWAKTEWLDIRPVDYARDKKNVDIEGKKALYEQAVNDANAIINSMNNCSSESYWQEDNRLYNLNPSVKVTYSDNTLYSIKPTEMKKVYKDNNKFQNNSSCSDVTMKVMDCDEKSNSCTPKQVKVRKCTSIEMSQSQEIQFFIPDNIYRYIIKEGHLSIHAEDLDKYRVSHQTLNYIDVGHGNFPVSFQTPTGIYGKNAQKGELSLTFSDLGHKVPMKQTMVDTILKNVDSNVKYGEYQCDFKVKNGIIDGEDPKDGKGGINVIYRPIDLANPFPDTDGSNRQTGSNWCNGDDCTYDNAIVTKYITNNREVKEDELYHLEPMYTFVLTPKTIKEIRDYNRNNSYDSYYGKAKDDKYYDFVCDTGENRHCISDYLTELIQLLHAEGTCTQNRKDSFDSCR